MDHATLDHDALTLLIARPPSTTEPVVSLYFGLNGGRADARAIVLKDLKKAGEDAIEKDARLANGLREMAGVALDRAHDAVAAALGRGDKHGTVFAFAWKDGFELHQIGITLPDRIAVGRTAYTSPLREVLEQNERYGIVIVDHERARICESFMGDVRQLEVVQDPADLNVVRAGYHGLEQSRMNHHHDSVLHRHVEHVAQRLFALHKRRAFDHLVLAGLPDTVAHLERSLHPYIRDRVVTRERWEHNLTTIEIGQRMSPIEAKVEAAREASVLALVRAHTADALATQGFEATARALAARKVATLVVEKDVVVPGHSCTACQSLSVRTKASGTPPCVACGGATRAVADVYHEATEIARLGGARVVTIAHDRAEITALGGVASILRFR